MERAGRAMVLTAVLGLVAAGCSSGGSDGSAADGARSTTTKPTASATTDATTTTAPAIHWPKPVFTKADCPMPLTDAVLVDVDCGYVKVPENRLDPDSAMIRLAVAHLHSTAKQPAPDPVVQLEGGPGFGSLENIENYSAARLLEHRDYYLWDQRGTGYSTPNLDCPEADDATWGIFATTDDPKVEGARIEAGLRACKARLVADGVDLDGYDTVQNAADLADLRVALGIDAWNLRGVSYGSALAIETVRSHPEGIRSALLDSVVVPDEPFGAVARGQGALRSFAELAKACAADSDCSSTYGPIDELIAKAAARLDDVPYRGTVQDPKTGDDHQVALVGTDLYAGLFNAMYDEALIPVIPAAMKSIADGDYAIIEQLAQQSIPFVTDQVEAMTTSVDCADRLSLLEPKTLDPFVRAHPELGGLVYLGAAERGCAEWGVHAEPPPFNTLLRKGDTKVPIMVMAGRFDPITPPAGTKRVADALGVKRLYFPNAGHGAVGSSDCARSIWFAFLDDPSAYPDTSCMDDLGPPDFS